MNAKLNRLLCGAAILVGTEFFLVAAPAFAQIDEIIVEARKREESLQDVPLAVTAFDKRALERTFADTVDELEKFIPNVELSDIQFAGQALGASIRGISFADLEKSFEPAVGFSVDGVFLATSTGAAIDMFDIESVEVLRGPQGTLYGRNTVGGVINVRRTRPTGEMGLRAKARFGSHSQEEYLVVANSPMIGDSLSAKVYAFSNKANTYAKNSLTNEKDPAADSIAYGAALSFEPSDTFQALVSLDIINDDSFAQPIYNLSENSETFCQLTQGFAATVIGPGLTLLPADQALSGCSAQGFAIAEASDFETYVRGVPATNFYDGFSLTGDVTAELNENLTFTSITGYREGDENLGIDSIGTPNINGALTGFQSVPIFYAKRLQNSDQFSQEFRFNGTYGDSIDYVAGLYYLNSGYDIRGGESVLGAAGGEATAFVFGAPASNFTAEQSLNAYAAFVDGTYQFNDRFSFSGGFRYTIEKKDFDIDFILPDLGSVSDSETWKSPTWRGILQYDFADNLMGFAGWSRGFRSGGYNGRATTPTSVGPYDPEKVDSFEAGLRFENQDRTLRFNPTVFYSLYKDKQEEILRPSPVDATVTETIVENASDVTIWGIEAEATFQPTEELLFRASAGYLNSDIDEFLINDLVNGGVIDVADERQVRRAPELSFAVGVDYRRQLSEILEGSVSANYSYKDEFATNLTIDTFPSLRRDLIESYDSLDLSVTLETTREDGANVSLSGYVNDVFGDVGALGSTLGVGVFYFAAGRPARTVGVELGVEF